MQKYNLPTGHELFQTQSIPELMLEWYEDLYAEKEELEYSLQEGAGQDLSRVMQRLESIQDVLKIKNAQRVVTGDRLVDYWESEIRAGREPDLDMQLEDIPNGRA